LHIPRNYHEQKAWPFVLALHGAFGTASTMERQSGFSKLADREGFVVAYPNGIGLFGYLQHWNAGHCCGLAEMDRVDDVGFLRYVIRDVSNRVHLDPQRLYVVGYSNGAMLAYRFASEHSESITAVGVVAGSLGSSKGQGSAACGVGPPKTPVPLIAIHGRDDETIPFVGGPGLRSGPRHYVPVIESVGRWAQYCRCAVAPEVTDDPSEDRCTMTWRDGQEEPWVVLHILDHWKHVWPGTFVTGQLPPEHPVRMFDASQAIWDFFRSRTPQYSRSE
jgi:polyhydroxybutyrate depolymerase